MVATTDSRLINTVINVSNKFCSTVTVKFADNVNGAVECIKRTNVSMCVVDGELSDNYGMLLAKRIREMKRYTLIPIIFVSNKMDDLITAFKTIHCYDYFLKPVSVEDIYYVIKLFSNDFVTTVSRSNINKPHLVLGVSQGMLKIYIDEILMIEASRRKCIVHTCSQEYLFAKTLSGFYELVEQHGLLRAHRSYIINPMNVKQIDKSRDVWIVRFFESDKTSPLSKVYKPEIMQKLSFLL